jgi:hypothetical protein
MGFVSELNSKDEFSHRSVYLGSGTGTVQYRNQDQCRVSGLGTDRDERPGGSDLGGRWDRYHTLGIFLHYVSDMQKYYTLRLRKGLISSNKSGHKVKWSHLIFKPGNTMDKRTTD